MRWSFVRGRPDPFSFHWSSLFEVCRCLLIYDVPEEMNALGKYLGRKLYTQSGFSTENSNERSNKTNKSRRIALFKYSKLNDVFRQVIQKTPLHIYTIEMNMQLCHSTSIYYTWHFLTIMIRNVPLSNDNASSANVCCFLSTALHLDWGAFQNFARIYSQTVTA